jgi:hypothetical protein
MAIGMEFPARNSGAGAEETMAICADVLSAPRRGDIRGSALLLLGDLCR